MWNIILPAGLFLAVLILTGIFVGKRTRFNRRIEQAVDDLLAASIPHPERVVRPADWAGLPGAVQQYFEHVLPEGRPYIETVAIAQRGTFRDGTAASAAWSPFTATQHVTTRPPGFVWNATIQMMPGLSVRVLDAYRDGQGILRAALGGAVSVMDATPGPMLDEGELLRYLAEAPLYPTALLPSMGVEWTPIDDHTARATLTDRGTTASLAFHFNERGEVEMVNGRRGFMTEGGRSEYRPWKGYWRRYEERDGMRVPTEGEVAWIHPEGEISYWRGDIRRIEYNGARSAREGEDSAEPPLTTPASRPKGGSSHRAALQGRI